MSSVSGKVLGFTTLIFSVFGVSVLRVSIKRGSILSAFNPTYGHIRIALIKLTRNLMW